MNTDRLIIAVSNRQNGTMLDRSLVDRHDDTVVANRRAFCDENGIDYDTCVYQIISYDSSQSYDVLQEVDAPNTQGVYADVLYTETPGLGLFLPIADCVGTVVYDRTRGALALAHLGRHASVAKAIQKTIGHCIQRGSVPDDLHIWMAPSVSKADYVMEYFDHITDPDWAAFAEQKADGIHLDLQGFNKNLAMKAGVPENNIVISPINTAQDSRFFSHSQGDTNGRFAVLAMMK